MLKINTPILLLALFVSTLLISCGGSAGDAASSTTTSTEAKPKGDAAAPDNVKFFNAVKHYRAIIPAVESADFVFYTEFGSASSGVQDLAQIRNFDKFITGQPATNPDNCKFDGASVLYDKEGKILCEMDFVLKPGCEHVRLRMNDEYTLHGFTPQAVAYFNQFVQVIKNMK